MATFFAPRALLADGWRHQVRITVNDAGIIERVTPDSDAHDAIRLPGATLPSRRYPPARRNPSLCR